MHREYLFKEFQKETKKQLNSLYLLIVILLISSFTLAGLAYRSQNAVKRIMIENEYQMKRLNESYQLQIECLQETYKFEDYECL